MARLTFSHFSLIERRSDQRVGAGLEFDGLVSGGLTLDCYRRDATRASLRGCAIMVY